MGCTQFAAPCTRTLRTMQQQVKEERPDLHQQLVRLQREAAEGDDE